MRPPSLLKRCARPVPHALTDAPGPTAFGPDSDLTSRHVALRKSREHGLSLAAIARRTVELVLSSALADLPPTVGPARAIEAFRRVDRGQMELVRSLEWLTAEKETYEDAVKEANALARWFLCAHLSPLFCLRSAHTHSRPPTTTRTATDAPHAARELLRRLPTDLLSSLAASPAGTSPAVQLDIREHLDYVALFNCLEMQARWAEAWARRPAARCVGARARSFPRGVLSPGADAQVDVYADR